MVQNPLYLLINTDLLNDTNSFKRSVHYILEILCYYQISTLFFGAKYILSVSLILKAL